MIFLPIVGRELRVAARRRSVYWLRAAAAALAMFIGGWVMLVTWGDPPSKMAQSLFIALATLALIGASLTGVMITSDCLSEEKRDGTLGLLFLTDLKGYDIVLGKLAATSLNAVYALMAILPVLALPLLLGGVSPDQFWRIALVSLNTLFFSLTAGILASAFSQDERRAMGLTVVILLISLLGLPSLMGFLRYKHIINTEEPWFLEACPAYSAVLAFDDVYRSRQLRFWRSTGIIHALSWFFIITASWITSHSWKDKAASARRLRWREQWKLWCLGNSEQRRTYRSALLNVNPILWLSARNRLNRTFVWAFLAVSACLWLWGYLVNRSDWLDTLTYIFTAMALHTILKLWLSTEACRRFSEDRNIGALELLLSTPLRVSEILSGQLLALRHQFGIAVLVVLGVDFVFLLATRAGTFQSSEKTFLTWMFLSGMGVFVFDLAGIAWTGMWLGLTSRKSNRATYGVIWRVMMLPWLLFGGTMTALVLMDEVFRIPLIRKLDQGGHGEYAVLALWFFISLGITGWFGLKARWRLISEFREVAMTRYSTSKQGSGWWPFRKHNAS